MGRRETHRLTLPAIKRRTGEKTWVHAIIEVEYAETIEEAFYRQYGRRYDLTSGGKTYLQNFSNIEEKRNDGA